MINQILAASTVGAPTPTIGMGATELMFSDRRAATIIAVTRFKTGARAGLVKTVTVQYDTATRTDGGGMSENQTHDFTPNPEGPTRTFTVNKHGQFKSSGSTLAIGYRSAYFDFSF